MSEFAIEPLAVPTSLDDSAASSDFLASIEVRNAVDVEVLGSTDFSPTAQEMLPRWQPDPHHPRQGWIARVDGRVVARGVWETGAGEAATTAWLDVRVLREHRGRGIGTALADLLERTARERGAEKVLAYVPSPPAAGERLAPPTGHGSVPADNAEVRFLLGRGWRLEQVERASRIALPHDEELVDRLLGEARAAAGDEYRVLTWTGRTPEEHVDDIVELLTRMSTDAPTAGLEEPEDPWTPDRLRQADDRKEAGGAVDLVAAIEHIPSGRLVAFTVLTAPAELDRVVQQEDTLVLSEHRGHRLGMLLKLENLRHLAETRPGHPAVVTYNAEENRHMLSVNEAVGFEPAFFEGAWRKDLD